MPFFCFCFFEHAVKRQSVLFSTSLNFIIWAKNIKLLSCPTEQIQTDLQQHEVDCKTDWGRSIKQTCLTHKKMTTLTNGLRRQYQVVEGEETSVLSEHVWAEVSPTERQQNPRERNTILCLYLRGKRKKKFNQMNHFSLRNKNTWWDVIIKLIWH